MSKIKVCYIISKIDKAVAFEWVAEHLQSEFELEFILINNKPETSLGSFLKNKSVEVKQYMLTGKLSLLFIFIRLFTKFLFSKPNVVHTHLFEASIVGLTAAKLAGVTKRIYTRHHSTYHHQYFKKAVKYDQFINSLATHIIAISNNVKEVLIEKENVNPDKICLVEHGFDLMQFGQIDKKRIDALIQKYQISTDAFIVGSIARYMEWKGLDYIVKGFYSIYKQFPKSHLLIANAGGPFSAVIKEELSKLPTESYTEIVFESDLFALYKLFDVYVHAPIDGNIEAFGQTYVEALASGIPSVFTLSGIAKDFIKDGENALVVDFKSSEQVSDSVIRLIRDKELRATLKKNGFNSIQRFNLSDFCSKLKVVYQSS